MSKSRYDLIIVGGGPGGLSASIYASRAKLKALLIEVGPVGGQLNVTDKIENYLGFERIAGTELANNFAKHAKSYGIEIISEEAINLNKSGKVYTITLSSGQTIESYTIILATGGRPKKLEIPGEKALYGKGVSYCATCDGFFFKNKNVLVIGGGDSAVEEAIYLTKICKKIYLAHRRNSLRASKILQKRLMKSSKAEILWNTIPTKVIAGDRGIESVDLLNIVQNKKNNLEIDGIFIFIGYKPNNQLVPYGVHTNSKGLVLTNESCESSVPGLYAIGDLRAKPFRQIVLSTADGCNAALSAAKYIEKLH